VAKSNKIILFGAGLVGRQVLPKYLERFNVLAIADNDPKKQSGTLSGVDIIHPQQIAQYDYDYLVITSTSIQPILDQVLSLGVAPDKVKQYVDHLAIAKQPFPWDAIVFIALSLAASVLAISHLVGGG
jgi:FlaA1/EpsC-like NDP-sugar epimerase